VLAGEKAQSMPAFRGHIFPGLTRTIPKYCGISLTKVTGSLNEPSQNAQWRADHHESLGQFKDHLRIASFYSVGENISALREQPGNTSKVLFWS
jgi:hypothetical protein